jgi:hypothetical protein
MGEYILAIYIGKYLLWRSLLQFFNCVAKVGSFRGAWAILGLYHVSALAPKESFSLKIGFMAYKRLVHESR